MSTSSSSPLLIPALLAVYIIWGSTYLGLKIATMEVPPFLFSAFRFLTAGSILLAFAIGKEKKWPTWKEVWMASIVGICLIGIGNTVVAFAVHYMPSGIVSLVVAAAPAWFILLDWGFFSKKKPTWLTIAGVLIGFLGLYLIFDPFKTDAVRDYPLWPIGIIIFGSITWVTGSLLSPRLQLPAQMTATSIQMIAGGIFSFIASLILEPNWPSFGDLTIRTYEAFAYLVIFGSLIGYSSYSWLVNNAPPRITATYAYVNPVVALFLGFWIANEHLSPEVLKGSAVVIAGVVLMTLRKK
ncbi:EamA family transporter [Chitinophaga skermanii]|nr:EamA family transporter [Chitinophaga skermanii]